MAKKLGEDGSQVGKAADEAAKTNVTQDVFLDGIRKLTAINEKQKKVNEERRAVRKQLKANGLELGALDAALKMADWERSEVREHFDLRRRYAQWLGLPIGTQAELFDGKKDDEILTEEWTAAGRTAALTGKPARPPENCPPAYHETFMKGFAEAADADFEGAAPAGPIDADKVVKEAKAAAAAKRAPRARTNV